MSTFMGDIASIRATFQISPDCQIIKLLSDVEAALQLDGCTPCTTWPRRATRILETVRVLPEFFSSCGIELDSFTSPPVRFDSCDAVALLIKGTNEALGTTTLPQALAVMGCSIPNTSTHPSVGNDAEVSVMPRDQNIAPATGQPLLPFASAPIRNASNAHAADDGAADTLPLRPPPPSATNQSLDAGSRDDPARPRDRPSGDENSWDGWFQPADDPEVPDEWIQAAAKLRHSLRDTYGARFVLKYKKGKYKACAKNGSLDVYAECCCPGCQQGHNHMRKEHKTGGAGESTKKSLKNLAKHFEGGNGHDLNVQAEIEARTSKKPRTA